MAWVGGDQGGNDGGVHVPDPRQFIDVRRIFPVAKTRQVPVGSAFSRVLRRRLPIHLKHGTAGLSQHAPKQMNIIDLHRSGSRLMGLIDTL